MCMFGIVKCTSNMDLMKVLVDTCLIIIGSSNMKRPVVTGSTVLKGICEVSIKKGFSEESVIIFDILEESLISILHASDLHTSKIRCSSENRLVVQSICTSDRLPGKVGMFYNSSFFIVYV